MKTKAQFFVAFEKVEKQDDGTMLVSGVASSEAVDSDGETITAEAMKAALPDYMKFGAIREMHQPIAAGSALKCEVDAEGVTHLEAKIVDPTTVMKIEEEVLKGFSVGGKITGRDKLNKTIITGIRLTEISVVDRPANPEAVFKLAKVDGADEPTLGELRKGMWTVENFADLLGRIGYMAQDTAWESEYEGDNSPVPAALRDWLAQGAEIFQAMAAEEIQELLATLPAAPTVEVMAMAAKLAKGEVTMEIGGSANIAGVPLAKAKFTATTKATLNAMHKVAMNAVGALADCWKDEEDTEDAGKAAPTGDVQKVEGTPAAEDPLAKMATLETDLAKAAGDLAKAQLTIDTLTARVAELEVEPAPPKGFINSNVTVGKADDHATPEADAALQKQAEEIAAASTPEEKARLLIKAIQTQAKA
jgi:hypothetical protein